MKPDFRVLAKPSIKGHLHCYIESKVTAILLKGGFYLGLELHREGSAPAQACESNITKHPIWLSPGLAPLSIYIESATLGKLACMKTY